MQGDFNVIDINNFYMVMFNLEQNKQKVIIGGAWMIFDHYMAITKWSPKFLSLSAQIERPLHDYIFQA